MTTRRRSVPRADKDAIERRSTTPDHLEVVRDRGQIWSHLRKKWLDETPEETIRQEFLCVLVNEYGYPLSHIQEELELTGRGSGKARADFVIWRSPAELADNRNPLIVVECKSNNVTIIDRDYFQGDSYARLSGAKFFVTHNTRETKHWRVLHDRMPKSIEEIENIPVAGATDKEIDGLLTRLKVFKEDEFARLLHQCHNIIRNREKKDPAAAFDEIAKILFIKVWVERELRARRRSQNLFSVAFLDEQLGDNPLEDLFTKTKAFYRADRIFDEDDHINLKPPTGREIVKKLERYNLSDTSEDIKGIAFERFLGRTFRGDMGQFFTPRTIVEFMIRFLNPVEGETICDPASGSGGFLIRFFEIVRERILADVDAEYKAYKTELEAKEITSDERAALLRRRYSQLQATVDEARDGSRLWLLANRCIYGTDANERMARTSKMNMIMHGDGHGGVHHRDGFLNVNGIFDGRFDIVLTNPPFGQKLEGTDVVEPADVVVDPRVEEEYVRAYGDSYSTAQSLLRANMGKPIASLFQLPRRGTESIKSEILFLERCINLLKPGGRLGIVLPEGVFNNPSLAYVRDFCEDRGFVRAVISLPEDTFASSGADVKASILFFQKFTQKEGAAFAKLFAECQTQAEMEVSAGVETAPIQSNRTGSRKKKAKQKMEKSGSVRLARNNSELLKQRTRSLLKERFGYHVFLYDAQSVGISATGAADENELYPNDRVPSEVEKTCLEHYHAFLENPHGYVLETTSDRD